MSPRWLTKKDIASSIRAQNVLNSMIKRGEVNVKDILQTRYVVCGCGEPGCGFISITKRRHKNER